MLVITFGSLVAAGLPLLTALIGVVHRHLRRSRRSAPCSASSATTSTLAMMIGLAVGIDYALFIVSRYRAELAEGREREEAAGRAVGTAGSAVVFAGLTVVIALVGLAVVNIPMLTKMGFAAAGTVVIAVLVAAHPGPRRCSASRASGSTAARSARPTRGPACPTRGQPAQAQRWAPAGRGFVLRRPVAVLLAGVLGLGAIAVPVAELELGLPDEGSQPTQHHPAPGLRPALRRLRPRLQRPADGRRRRRQSDDPKAAADAGRASGSRSIGRRRRPSPRPRSTRRGDTAIITVVPRPAEPPARPRSWSTPSAARRTASSPTTGARCWSPAPPR